MSGQKTIKSNNNKLLQESSASPVTLTHVSNATALRPKKLNLPSSISLVNQTLDGGLRWGELCEWGSPWGCGGREVVIRFLTTLSSSHDQQPNWCLWVQGQEGINIYPPSWEAQGVNLSYIRFTHSLEPIKDLKPLFLNPFFRIIVLDCPKKLSAEDCQFLARQARHHKQIIILIRNYFLSPKKGNVWAKLRLNCWRHHVSEKFFIKVIKGLSPRQISFHIDLNHRGES